MGICCAWEQNNKITNTPAIAVHSSMGSDLLSLLAYIRPVESACLHLGCAHMVLRLCFLFEMHAEVHILHAEQAPLFAIAHATLRAWQKCGSKAGSCAMHVLACTVPCSVGMHYTCFLWVTAAHDTAVCSVGETYTSRWESYAPRHLRH